MMIQEGNSHPIPLLAFGGVGFTPATLRQGVPRWNFDVTCLDFLIILTTMEAIREQLSDFNGRSNVTKVTNPETGAISYLTQSTPLLEEAARCGATVIDVAKTKPVLLLFNDNDACVAKAYISKALQGMSPSQIAERKAELCLFESYYADKKAWIPCVSISSNQGPSANAARL